MGKPENGQLAVCEGKQYQSSSEEKARKIDVTKWANTPSSITVKVYDESDSDADVTSTNMPTGSATASGNIITTPKLVSLTSGKTYRIEVLFTAADGNKYEPYFLVECV